MTYRLKCGKCGRTTTTARRVRRCRNVVEQAIGMNTPTKVYCYGPLVRVLCTKTQRTDLDNAAYAERMFNVAQTRMKRAMTSMEKWQRRRQYYLKKAEGEIRRVTHTKKPKADRHTRQIELEQD